MRTKKGIVGSTKMTGTVSVSVDSFILHPIYKKRFRRSKKFLADVNGLDIHEGDTVEITECRPISKNKSFKVTTVINAVPRVSEIDDSKDAENAQRREKEAPVEVKASKKTTKKESTVTDSPDSE